MDKEERWDLYIVQHRKREESNLDRINPLVGEFAEILKEKGVNRVLDLGCGVGRHCHYLAKRGFNVVGCDISGNTLEIAERLAKKRNLRIDFIQGDYLDLPFHNEVFEAVISIDTLHHDFFENIYKALREIHRVLTPGGLLCFNPLSVNDELFGQGRKLGEKLFIIHRIPHHFFDLEELKKLLERVSFELEKIEYIRFTRMRAGREIRREKLKIIARKVTKKKVYLSPFQKPLF